MRHFVLSLLLLIAGAPLRADEQAPSTGPEFRLRFEWGGGAPQLWNGVLEVSQGELRQPTSLGVEADEPGTLWLDDGDVWLKRRTPRVYDGLDVTLRAPSSAVLTFSLQAAGDKRPRERIELKVSDLYHKPQVVPLGAAPQRLVVQRMPGDALWVAFERPHLIFQPGEVFKLQTGLSVLDAKDKPISATLHWKITSQTATWATRPLAQGEAHFKTVTNAPRTSHVDLQLQVPSVEGVYNLRLNTRSRGLPDLERLVQFVVLAKDAPPADAAAGERVLSRVGTNLADTAKPSEVARTGTPSGSVSTNAGQTNAGQTNAGQTNAGQTSAVASSFSRPLKLVDEFQPQRTGPFRKIGNRGGNSPLDLLRPHRSPSSPAGSLDKQSANKSGPATAEALADKPVAPLPSLLDSADWTAWKLHIAHVDQPHLLVVTVSGPEQSALGMSLLQPNAAGQLLPVGLDSALVLPRTSRERREPANPLVYEHRLLFWPTVQEPVLFLSALRGATAATVTRVQVYEAALEATAGLSPLITLPASPSSASPSSTSPSSATATGAATPSSTAPHTAPPVQTRFVGPYLHKPLLPEVFGAAEFLDKGSKRSLDSWETFYTAGQRFVGYLKHHACNCAMLPVYADGSTLYPSLLLDASPRYDTGVFASTAQDPIRKDVAELLFQLFDRAGLSFIPEFQFSTPLPQLERLLASRAADTEGLTLVHGTGQTWIEKHGSLRGQAPYYNPLDPRVQDAVIEVVSEFVDRYQQHPSCRAIALELGPHTFLQFPGLDWGYDAPTLARFERDTHIQLPRGDDATPVSRPPDPRLAHEFLTTKAPRDWQRWRCQELARFHLRLVRAVTSRAPQMQVIFSGQRLFQSGHELLGEHPQRSSPLSDGHGPEQLLIPQGLDFSLYGDERGLMVLRPALERPLELTSLSTWTETLNTSPALDAAFKSVNRGTLLYHAPLEQRWPEFDLLSPWQPAYTWLVPSIATTGDDARKRWTRALAALDGQAQFVGGWTMCVGQEDVTRPLRQSLAALPAVRFQRSGPEIQPLTIRTATLQGRTYVYVVNDSPWGVRADLSLHCSPRTICRRIGAHAGPVALSSLAAGLPAVNGSTSHPPTLNSSAVTLPTSNSPNLNSPSATSPSATSPSATSPSATGASHLSTAPHFTTIKPAGVVIIPTSANVPGAGVSSPAAGPVSALGSGGGGTATQGLAPASRLSLALEPYDIWCGYIEAPHVEVHDARAHLPTIALDWMRDRIQHLQARLTAADPIVQPKATPLRNAGFEAAENTTPGTPPQLSGWEILNPSQNDWAYDPRNPHSGKSALRLASQQELVSLRSQELPLDDSRQLTWSLWLRGSRSKTRVKLAFEAECDGQRYVQSAIVEVGPEWKRFTLRAKDLPSRKLQHPRVRVDALDPGQLWIDDVEIQGWELTPDDLRQLTKTYSAVKIAFEEQRFADCQRLLDGYWGQYLFQNTTVHSTADTPAKHKLGDRMRHLFRK